MITSKCARNAENENLNLMTKQSNVATEPSLALGAPAEVTRQVTDLAAELARICKRLGGEAFSREGTTVNNFVDQIDLCSKLLSQLDSTAGDLRQRLGRVEAHNHELSLQLEARSNESQTDGLTGVANRRSFDREFAERCLAAQQSHCPLTLVFIDIDHFKSVNDCFGHHVGDAVLRGLARLLKKNVPHGVLLARYGGEEFSIVFMGLSIDDAIAAIEHLRKIVSETQFCYEGKRLGLTISCGLAQLDNHEHSEHLLQRADAAMYASKQAGRNRTFWDSGQQLHVASTAAPCIDEFNSNNELEHTCSIVELSTKNIDPTTDAEQDRMLNSLSRRTTRANWCDGAMLFWNIRQRLAEWKGGGERFCVMALEVDDGPQIAQSYGIVALHFMMRAQLLHLDATLRDMDIVGRIGSSRLVVVFPRAELASLTPIFRRLRDTMDRFVFPVSHHLLEYSVSIGVTEADEQDEPQRILGRAEEALAYAQRQGKGSFSAQSASRTWMLELD